MELAGAKRSAGCTRVTWGGMYFWISSILSFVMVLGGGTGFWETSSCGGCGLVLVVVLRGVEVQPESKRLRQSVLVIRGRFLELG